jgi:hypothetical protein
MLVSPDRSSATPTAADDTAILEALADAGDAMTAALVAHDLDAITAATRTAETLCGRLETTVRAPRASRRDRELRGDVVARIGAAARRNAVLLESAWATDAAILRLRGAAAVEQADAQSSYQVPVASPPPAGWLDRSA